MKRPIRIREDRAKSFNETGIQRRMAAGVVRCKNAKMLTALKAGARRIFRGLLSDSNRAAIRRNTVGRVRTGCQPSVRRAADE
jgi:hypothetical protein